MNVGDVRGLPPPMWEEDPDWTCALDGCSRIVVRATLFCHHHWTILPARLQRLCVLAWARRQAGDPRADEARAVAIEQGARYIHWLRGD